MGGGLAGELEDELAEVGLPGLDPLGLEKGGNAELLGEHALGLDGDADPVGADDLAEDPVRVLGPLGEVDDHSPIRKPTLGELEVAVEPGEHVLLDLSGIGPPLLDGNFGVGPGPVPVEVERRSDHRLTDLGAGL